MRVLVGRRVLFGELVRCNDHGCFRRFRNSGSQAGFLDDGSVLIRFSAEEVIMDCASIETVLGFIVEMRRPQTTDEIACNLDEAASSSR